MDGGGVLGSGGGGLVGGGTNLKKTGAVYNYRYSLFSMPAIQYILIIFTLTLQSALYSNFYHYIIKVKWVNSYIFV